MLDAHQMNVFLVAAETLSFTQTAQRIHMTQPSVSQHIQTLEKHFGTSLFVRNGRNLELTDAGLALVPMAREIVNLSQRVEEAMASIQGKISGHLHVGCSTTPGKYILPLLLASFHQQYPQVRATCHVFPQQQMHRMLYENAVHVALSSTPGSFSHDTDYRKFMRDEIVLIAPTDHPWAGRGEIVLEDLFEAVYILREEDSGTQTAVRQALANAGISTGRLNVLLTLGNSEAITLAVQQGLGVGFVSEIVVSRVGQGQVVPIRVRSLEISRDIYIGRNPCRQPTLAQNAFWDFVTTQGGPIVEQISTKPIRPA
jgi:DNA-binding transcriptional LysR family regulator